MGHCPLWRKYGFADGQEKTAPRRTPFSLQPELRRILGELGNIPLLANAHEQRENIEVIIQTVERLSLRDAITMALKNNPQSLASAE